MQYSYSETTPYVVSQPGLLVKTDLKSFFRCVPTNASNLFDVNRLFENDDFVILQAMPWGHYLLCEVILREDFEESYITEELK